MWALVGVYGNDLLFLLIPAVDRLVARILYPIEMVQANIEPYRAIERPVLMETHPCELIVKSVSISFGREVPLTCTPVRDRTSNAVYQLLERVLTTSRTRILACVGKISVEIFASHHVGSELTP